MPNSFTVRLWWGFHRSFCKDMAVVPSLELLYHHHSTVEFHLKKVLKSYVTMCGWKFSSKSTGGPFNMPHCEYELFDHVPQSLVIGNFQPRILSSLWLLRCKKKTFVTTRGLQSVFEDWCENTYHLYHPAFLNCLRLKLLITFRCVSVQTKKAY